MVPATVSARAERPGVVTWAAPLAPMVTTPVPSAILAFTGVPRVTEKLIPVFTSVELSKLERACRGRSFAQCRDAAIIAVFEATGMRLSELAGIRYDPVDAERSDLDLWQREVTVRGKNGKQRIVKISYPAARTVDRYIRARSRHAQSWRPQLWLGSITVDP